MQETKPAEVMISIFNTAGILAMNFHLGHQKSELA